MTWSPEKSHKIWRTARPSIFRCNLIVILVTITWIKLFFLFGLYFFFTKVKWLRLCATNRKVAGSIPDGVFGIFHWHNPFCRTMGLGSTQPLTELSTRRISCALLPYHFPVPLSWNVGTLTPWNPLGHSRLVTGLLYLYRSVIQQLEFILVFLLFNSVLKYNNLVKCIYEWMK